MIDPLSPKASMEKIKEKIANLSLYDLSSVYPEEMMEQVQQNIDEGDYLPPSCIFLPDQSFIRTIIRTNVKFSSKDSLEKFLLRFGLFANYNWYIHNQ